MRVHRRLVLVRSLGASTLTSPKCSSIHPRSQDSPISLVDWSRRHLKMASLIGRSCGVIRGRIGSRHWVGWFRLATVLTHSCPRPGAAQLRQWKMPFLSPHAFKLVAETTLPGRPRFITSFGNVPTYFSYRRLLTSPIQVWARLVPSAQWLPQPPAAK